mgnify:CR=1 FL=1
MMHALTSRLSETISILFRHGVLTGDEWSHREHRPEAPEQNTVPRIRLTYHPLRGALCPWAQVGRSYASRAPALARPTD